MVQFFEPSEYGSNPLLSYCSLGTQGGELLNGLALCTGIAGLDIGIKSTIPNSRTVCYVEGEAYPAALLVTKIQSGLLDDAPIYSDVTTFDGTKWTGKVDYISAGFPCQPWSKAGSKKGTSDPRWLWPHIARIIREVRPQFLFLKNVPDIINGGLSPLLWDLATLGFDAEWGTLKASDVGACHQRDRFFLFAHNVPDSNNHRQCTVPKHGEQIASPPKSPQFTNSLRERLEGHRDFTFRKEPQFPPSCGSRWWSSEPDLDRVAHGVPNRVDRIRSLGNAVVPLQATIAYSILINRKTGGV